MKVLLALSALVALSNGLRLKVTNTQCEGTICPGGCCPMENWYCCPEAIHCHATQADCPFVATKAKLVKMAAKKQCDGTICPAGCCVGEYNWFCCLSGFCAATAAECP